MRRTWLLAAVVLSCSSTAFAQEEEESTPLSAAPIEQKNATKLNEVEHGFFIGAATGINLMISPGGTTWAPDDTGALADSGKAGLAMGQSGGFELGFEPTPMFAVGAMVWGSAANTSSRYYGTCDPTNPPANATCPHGNFTALLLAVDARVNVSLGPDANDVRRAFFFFRAGAGFSILSPKIMLANEPVVFGGPGLEYFTHLRHFSVGIEADGSYGLTNKGLGVSLQPLVRYTF